MATNVKKRSQRLSRRKETLLKKAHEMGVLCDVDVALYLRYRRSGRLITYKSINRQCWPPTQEQIDHTYPIPLVLLPKDMEAKFGKAWAATEDTGDLRQPSSDENDGSTKGDVI